MKLHNCVCVCVCVNASRNAGLPFSRGTLIISVRVLWMQVCHLDGYSVSGVTSNCRTRVYRSGETARQGWFVWKLSSVNSTRAHLPRCYVGQVTRAHTHTHTHVHTHYAQTLKQTHTHTLTHTHTHTHTHTTKWTRPELTYPAAMSAKYVRLSATKTLMNKKGITYDSMRVAAFKIHKRAGVQRTLPSPWHARIALAGDNSGSTEKLRDEWLIQTLRPSSHQGFGYAVFSYLFMQGVGLTKLRSFFFFFFSDFIFLVGSGSPCLWVSLVFAISV